MYVRCVELAVFILLSQAFADPIFANSTSQAGADFGAVIQVLNKVLAEQEEYTPDGFPKLTSAEVSLATTVTKEGNLKVKFFIFKIGSEVSYDNSALITVLMKTPPPSSMTLQSIDKKEWSEVLAKNIALAKQGFVEAQKATNKSLTTRQVVLEISFGVRLGGEGGAETPEILPVTLDLSGGISKGGTHTLRLVFGED